MIARRIYYVAPVTDSYLELGLEVVRVLLRPNIFARPHITVKGPYAEPDRHADTWLRESPAEVVLSGVGQWSVRSRGESHTVFLRAQSPGLEVLCDKPEYPLSPLHLTLYDGPDAILAERLRSLLEASPLRATYPVRYLEPHEKTARIYPRRAYLIPCMAAPYVGHDVEWRQLAETASEERFHWARCAWGALSSRYPG